MNLEETKELIRVREKLIEVTKRLEVAESRLNLGPYSPALISEGDLIKAKVTKT